MPSPFIQSTPTKPTHPGGGASFSPAKFGPSSPSKSCRSLQSPIKSGLGTPNDDAKEIVERRRARQSKTPTKPLTRFDSICQDSKVILNDMAGMFSPKKAKAETLGGSPFKTEIEVPPVVLPVRKEQSGRNRRDDQRKRGQARRKRVVDPGRIRRPAHTPADPIPEEGGSTHRP